MSKPTPHTKAFGMPRKNQNFTRDEVIAYYAKKGLPITNGTISEPLKALPPYRGQAEKTTGYIVGMK